MATYQAKATRRHRLKRREFLFEYKKQHPCVYCGQSNPLMLDLDHIDRSTKKGVPAMMVTGGCKWSSVLEEIEKCQVVCSNCHRVKSILEDNKMRGVDIEQYIPDNMRHLLSEEKSSSDNSEYHQSFTDKKREKEVSYTWIHDSGNTFIGTRYDLRKMYPELDIQALQYVTKGIKQTNHKGWRLGV